MASQKENLKAARSGEGDKLWSALRSHIPDALECALTNRNLNEEMALFIAKSKGASLHVLGALASDVRFRRSYKMQLALVKNPRTPNRIVLTLLKHIKIFDLADISRSHFVNSLTRKKVEFMLRERIPSMPSGLKSALSRRASANIIFYIMDRSDRRVIDICLDSERLTEDMVVRAIQRKATKMLLVKAIAEHVSWPLRQRIAYALIRNFNTPLAIVQGILPRMRVADLRELYADSGVPESTRPLIHSELVSRDVDVSIPPDKIYMVEDDAGELSEDVLDGEFEEIVGDEQGYDDESDESQVAEYELSDDDELTESDWELGCNYSELSDGEEDGSDESEGWDELG